VGGKQCKFTAFSWRKSMNPKDIAVLFFSIFPACAPSIRSVFSSEWAGGKTAQNHCIFRA
jgi:hypothetical protein